MRTYQIEEIPVWKSFTVLVEWVELVQVLESSLDAVADADAPIADVLYGGERDK